ncbi:DUF1572 family protein [Sporosarcina sp. 179-K 3D1 HS]|uniref:DUF1572 family protein n=1 Tax=Sporosarcina sp. 179-K 3D1 HS TaxID=3232169 RepID=UPI0039A287A6
MSVETEYLRVMQERFAILKEQGEKTFAQLEEEDFHWTLHHASNSIAIIIQHMSGNMISRWTDFLTSDGEKSDRNREGEFLDHRLSREELMVRWDRGWKTFFETVRSLGPKDLLKPVRIRGEQHSVLDAIERQLAHYATHIGQILFIGKQIKGDDWKSLSIPKGESAAYLKRMQEENK